MMQFISAKAIGASAPQPHILFNLAHRRGTSEIETAIRNNDRFKHSCMSNTLKKYKAFSDPIEGKNFVWYSRKPYSDEAWFNIIRVAREFYDRINK